MSGRRLLALASVAAVLLQLPGRLEWAVAALGVQLLAMAVWDRDALRGLGRWRLWALVSAASLLSGLLLAPPEAHLGPLPLSLQGLRTAALMLCRAVTLFGVALVASRQLTADRVIRAAQRLGMRQVGLALGVAVETLPRLMAAARSERALQGQDAARGVVGRVVLLENVGIRLLQRAEDIVQDITANRGEAPDEPRSRSPRLPGGSTRGGSA